MFLLAHENEEEYRDLLAGLAAAHQPRDRHEEMLVQELADASWAWQRARATDQEFWDYMAGHYSRTNAGIAEALAQEKEVRFRTHLRQMAQVERQYYRALAAVERMHRNRDRGTSIPYKGFRKTAAAGAAVSDSATQHADGPVVDAPTGSSLVTRHSSLDQLATSHKPLATNSSLVTRHSSLEPACGHATLVLRHAPRRASSPSPRHATGLLLIPGSSNCSQSPPLTPAGFSFSEQCNSITVSSMVSSPPSFRMPEAVAS
jgi:hypothetical protein